MDSLTITTIWGDQPGGWSLLFAGNAWNWYLFVVSQPTPTPKKPHSTPKLLTHILFSFVTLYAGKYTTLIDGMGKVFWRPIFHYCIAYVFGQGYITYGSNCREIHPPWQGKPVFFVSIGLSICETWMQSTSDANISLTTHTAELHWGQSTKSHYQPIMPKRLARAKDCSLESHAWRFLCFKLNLMIQYISAKNRQKKGN